MSMLLLSLTIFCKLSLRSMQVNFGSFEASLIRYLAMINKPKKTLKELLSMIEKMHIITSLKVKIFS
jgi:hypothetical protein